jgi:hypothetical protein
MTRNAMGVTPSPDRSRVQSRHSRTSADCADVLTANPLPGGRSSRQVGTTTRSAQSAIPHALVSDFVPLSEQHFADEHAIDRYLSAQ